MLLDKAKEICKQKSCYKLSLNCNESSKNFSILAPEVSVKAPPAEPNALFGVHFSGEEKYTKKEYVSLLDDKQ